MANIQNIGLMMTCNEVDVIEEVMREHQKYFDKILVLDGSSDGTDDILRSFSSVKFFIKDSDLPYAGRVRDGARQFLLQKAQELYGCEGWFTLLHGDEIFWDDPNQVAEQAQKQWAEKVNWQPMNFYLHVSDRGRDLAAIKSVQERILWYSPAPSLEIRQFKNKPGIHYDLQKHSCVLPEGEGLITFIYFPVYKHYLFRSPEQMLKKHQEGEARGYFSPTMVKKTSWERCFCEKLGKVNRKFDGSFHEFEMKNQLRPRTLFKRIFWRTSL